MKYSVILSHLSHPGNIGASARAMKTMGVNDLRLVNCVDYKNQTAYNRSSGAEDILFSAKNFTSVQDALADCDFAIAMTARNRKITTPPSLCASNLPDYIIDKPALTKIALVFGNEQNGLDNHEISLCNLQVNVPTNKTFSSLNVASCVQIITFLVMQMTKEQSILKSEQKLASHKKINALNDTFCQIAFSKPDKKSEIDFAKFRQLLFRLNPNEDEIDFLHGIFKRIYHKS